MAPFTFLTSASFFSRKVARRIRIVSRIPPASPAATMFTYRLVNARGCFDKASATVLPDSTSNTTFLVTSASALLSVCSARIVRACTSGRPELIIVENWRVKMTTSRVLIEPRPIFFAASWSILTTLSRCFRSCAITSSREAASIVAVRRSPLNALAVYVNVAIYKPLLTSHWGARCGPTCSGRFSGRRLAGSAFICRIQLANHALELGWVTADAQAFVRRHFAVHVQLVERIVQRLHA